LLINPISILTQFIFTLNSDGKDDNDNNIDDKLPGVNSDVDDEANNDRELNGPILSLTVYPPVSKLDPPVRLTFEHEDVSKKSFKFTIPIY